jgi:hypothetical protein
MKLASEYSGAELPVGPINLDALYWIVGRYLPFGQSLLRVTSAVSSCSKVQTKTFGRS